VLIYICGYFLRWDSWNLWTKGNKYIQSCWYILSNHFLQILVYLYSLQHYDRASFKNTLTGIRHPHSSYSLLIFSWNKHLIICICISFEYVWVWTFFMCLPSIVFPLLCIVCTWVFHSSQTWLCM
jgi:hypothetical protein